MPCSSHPASNSKRLLKDQAGPVPRSRSTSLAFALEGPVPASRSDDEGPEDPAEGPGPAEPCSPEPFVDSVANPGAPTPIVITAANTASREIKLPTHLLSIRFIRTFIRALTSKGGTS